MRLLIVDDDYLFTQMLPRELHKRIARPALEIRWARSPAEAETAWRAGTFDVILCDFDLKAVETGIDVLRRAGEADARTLRILITGHSPGELPPHTQDAYDAFIEKPMTLREVVPLLVRILESKLGLDVVLHEAA